ncbi:hypothetical protein ACFLQR_00925 [Verrucomicrobiota bacterium]
MRRIALLLAMILVLAVRGSAGPDEVRVAKRIRYPDYDDKGKLNFELVGDEARIRPDGLIDIKNLTLIFYEEGKVMMRVTSPRCLFDRVNSTAVSTSRVCVTRAEIVLTGKGFEWSAKGGGFKIHNEAKVVLVNEKPEPGPEKRP